MASGIQRGNRNPNSGGGGGEQWDGELEAMDGEEVETGKGRTAFVEGK